MGKPIHNTSCHCLKMRRSAENVVAFYDEMLKPSGITSRQFSLLYQLSLHKGCNVSELARATELDRSTLARSLKPLMKQGLIADEKGEGSRDSRLNLTEQGRKVTAEAETLWTQAQTKFEENVGHERLKALEDALLALQDL